MPASQKREVFLLLLMTLFVKFSELSNPVDKTVGQPWPMPSNYQAKTNVLLINGENFRFSYDGNTQCRNEVIDSAFVRYHRIIFGSTAKPKFQHQQRQNEIHTFNIGQSSVQELQILVEGKCEDIPSLEMSENCECSVVLHCYHGYVCVFVS